MVTLYRNSFSDSKVITRTTLYNIINSRTTGGYCLINNFVLKGDTLGFHS